jgi:hypothetical protein
MKSSGIEQGCVKFRGQTSRQTLVGAARGMAGPSVFLLNPSHLPAIVLSTFHATSAFTIDECLG